MRTLVRVCYLLSIVFWFIVWGGAFGDHPTNSMDITGHQLFAWLGLPFIVGMIAIWWYVGQTWHRLGTGGKVLVSLPAFVTPVVDFTQMAVMIGIFLVLGALWVLYVS